MTESPRPQRTKPVRAPSLTLSLLPGGPGYEVWLGDGSVDRPGNRIGYGPVSRVENELLPLIRETLEPICKNFGDKLDPEDAPHLAAVALQELNIFGKTVWDYLLDPDALREVWLAVASKSNHLSRRLRLEFRTPAEWPIPFELLPLASPPQSLDRQSSAASLSDGFEEALCNFSHIFPAFSAVTRHTVFDAVPNSSGGLLPTKRHIPSSSSLALVFLWHSGAPSAKEASESITALHDSRIRVAPDGPFPRNRNLDSPRAVAGLLVDQGTDPEYHIVHIHAHGVTGEPSLQKPHTLYFAYETEGTRSFFRRSRRRSTRDVVVTNRNLLDAYDPTTPLTETGPLIFINACGATAASYSGGLGLARFFLRHGYRAIVGPRVAIPGPAARRMAQYFYEQLLRGNDLAEALLESRTQLFNNYFNPLGALYTIHGESGLHIVGEAKK